MTHRHRLLARAHSSRYCIRYVGVGQEAVGRTLGVTAHCTSYVTGPSARSLLPLLCITVRLLAPFARRGGFDHKFMS